jgi:hypothetical protein
LAASLPKNTKRINGTTFSVPSELGFCKNTEKRKEPFFAGATTDNRKEKITSVTEK